MATIGTVEGILRLRDEFTSTLTRASQQLEQTGRKMQRVGRQMQATGAQLTAGVTLPLAAIGAAAVKMASDAEEAANKFNVVMGESADDVRERFLKLRDTLPLTLDEMERLAAGVQDLLVPFGVARDQAAQMSAQMVELAGDVASFNNVSPERVLEAISSALAGSSEPMRRFGVDTRVTRLEALALSEELIEVGDELDSTATAQATLIAIQRDSTDAMGDAARTVDSTANQMRFLARDVREATQALGDALIPVARSLIGALRPIVQEFANLSPKMRTAIVAVGALAAAVGPLLIGLGSLIRLLGFAATGLSTFAARAATARVAVLNLNTALGSAGLAAGLGLVIAASKALERVSGDLDAAIQRDVQASNAASIAFRVLVKDEQVTAQEAAKLVKEFQRVNGQIEKLEKELANSSQEFKLMRGELVPVGRDSAQVEQALEMLRAKSAQLRNAIDKVGEFSLKASEDMSAAEQGAEELENQLADLEMQLNATGDSAEDFDAKIQAILDELFPIEAQIRATEEQLGLIAEAMSRGGRDADELREAYQRLVERLLELDGAATEAGDAIDLVVGDGATEGVRQLADEVSRLIGEVEQQNQAVSDQAAEWIQVGQAAAQAFREIDDDAARVIQAVVAMTAAMIAFAQAATAAATAVAALNIAAAAFALFSLLAGGGRRTQVSGPIEIGPGGAATGDLSESLGFSIDSVREAFGQFLDAFNAALRETMQAISLTIPETMEPVFFEFEKVFKDGQLRFVRVIVDGVTESFDTAEQAIGFALQKFLQAVVEAGGQVDEAVRQIIEGFSGDPAQFQAVLSRVQGLADQALMTLDGFSAIEVELMRLPAQLQALRQELNQLGLSADQVERLVGGQLVASFQALRQQITGEQLSVERRREIAEAQRQLFNAELELRIAELEARKQELLAKAGLTQEQIKIINAELSATSAGLKGEAKLVSVGAKLDQSSIDASAKFLKAQGKIFEGQARVQGGFISTSVGLVRTGLEAFTIATKGIKTVLGSLPPEIAKQVKAIQAVIDALKKIGTIKAGDIKIPDIDITPPGGDGGGGIGGIIGPTLQEQVRALLDQLFPKQARLRELRQQIALLDKALAKGKISAGTYEKAIEKIQQEMDRLRTEGIRNAILQTIDNFMGLADEIAARIRELQSALAGLAQFRAGLLIGPQTALRPGARLAEAERQFRAAVARAQAGDVSAIADVQRLGQQLLTLGGRFFGTSGAGFQRLFRLVQDLTGDILEEGNDLIETELDRLEDINNQIADLLESNKEVAELLGLTQADIKEIRERGLELEEGTNKELAELKAEQRKELRKLQRQIDRMINVLEKAS